MSSWFVLSRQAVLTALLLALFALVVHTHAQAAEMGASGSAVVAAEHASAPATPVINSCFMVFGHGRNFDPSQATQNEHWDQVNVRFNSQVLEHLQQAGHVAHAIVLKVSALDLAKNLQLLLAQAARFGCAQVLETTVFADVDSASFKARLRLYPVLGMKGPRLADAGISIGQPLYTNERGFELSQRNLDRLRPEVLARTMSQEFLAALAGAARVDDAPQAAAVQP